MNALEENLRSAISEILISFFSPNGSDGSSLQLQKTRKEFAGDVTLVVFPLTRMTKLSPEATAQFIGEALVKQSEVVTGFNVVKGFLNIEIEPTYWIGVLRRMLADDNLGLAKPKSRGQVMVEFSSPNTNKPLHLGHLRNNFLGFSVARILEAHGHDVVKVQIINDRGIHICKSMLAWQKFGRGETPASSGLKGDKLVGKYYVAFDKAFKSEVSELMATGLSEDQAKKDAPIMKEAQQMLLQWEHKDPEIMHLWPTMNGWVYEGFDATYREMGVSFDKLYYESNTYLTGKDEVMRGLQEGVFSRREDGSIWVDLTADGLDEKLLLRGDGTAVYMTQDIGTAILRFKEYPQLTQQIYTVGNEQEYHFRVLFMILAKLGFPQALNNFHLSYGMVELPDGKMKSREGTVVDADDLLAEMATTAAEIAAEQGKLDALSDTEKQRLHKIIGYGALKYYLLKVDPKKKMMFNPKESIDFFGNTAPFIQFNYVRTLALLRKAAEENIVVEVNEKVKVSSTELDLIKLLSTFPEVVAEAAKSYDPSHVANYVYDLVKEYSSFYQSSPVLKEADEALRSLRLALAAQTGKVVQQGMYLLGVEMPERM